MFIIKYIKVMLYTLLGIIISAFISALLSYFNILSDDTIKYIKLIFIILSFFIGGFYIGTKSNKNGYLEGLKLGGLIISVLFLFNFLGLKNNISLGTMIYYIIILISVILGSIVGINKRLKNKY